MRALESGGRAAADSLKQIGDVSLFMSGFFPDSFRRKLVDVDYYVQIGGLAYNALSRQEPDTFCAGLLGARREVRRVRRRAVRGQRAVRPARPTLDLLRLYERWLTTGSLRSGQLLVERGVVPNTQPAQPQGPVGREPCHDQSRRPIRATAGRPHSRGNESHTSTIFRHSVVSDSGQPRLEASGRTNRFGSADV